MGRAALPVATLSGTKTGRPSDLPVWIEEGGEHDRMHVTSFSNKQAASPDVLATCACNALHVRSGYGWLHLQLIWDRQSVQNGQLQSILSSTLTGSGNQAPTAMNCLFDHN
jgi:hypothetical protein